MLEKLNRTTNIFLSSITFILVIVGLGKIIGVISDLNPLMIEPDPVLLLPRGYVFLLAGIVECAIAVYLFLPKQQYRKLALVVWLGSALALYRVGLWLADPLASCGCTGSIGFIFNLTMEQSEGIATSTFWYLFSGSLVLFATQYWMPHIVESATKRRSLGNVSRAIVFVSTLGVASLANVTAQPLGEKEAIEISGRLVTQRIRSGKTDESLSTTNLFKVTLAADLRCLIEVRPVSAVKEIWYFGYDGAQTYEVKYGGLVWVADDEGNSRQIENLPIAEKEHWAYLWDGDFFAGDVDRDGRPTLLWLAFGSADHWKATRGENTPLPWMYARNNPLAFGFNCEYEITEQAPRFPVTLNFFRSSDLDSATLLELLEAEPNLDPPTSKDISGYYMRRFQERKKVWKDGFVAGRYRVTEFAEAEGLKLPSKFELKAFRPQDKGAFFLACSGTVTNSARVDIGVFTPPILGPLIVVDQRFRYRNTEEEKHFASISYNLTPGEQWKPKEAPELKPVFEEQLERASGYWPASPLGMGLRIGFLVAFVIVSFLLFFFDPKKLSGIKKSEA